MKTKYTRLVAAVAALITGASCSVSITPPGGGSRSCAPTMRRGPIAVNDWGIPTGNQPCGNQQYGSSFGGIPYSGSQYGSQYGSSGNQVQDNGSLRWDHHSSVVKIPISGNSRRSYSGAPTNYGNTGSYGQPMSSGGSRYQPSGRTVVCPGCGQRIGNAPAGTFPCQKCGATVSN